jgi:ketosteroid isomerase-like protein
MSQENVNADFEVIRRAWRASGQKDLAALERDLDPDIVTIPFGAAMEGKSYRGVNAVVGWLRDEIWANWEHFDTVPEEFTRVGQRILVTGRWHACGKASGVELDIPATWVVEVHDGKITYWRTYTDRHQALRDIGLEA